MAKDPEEEAEVPDPQDRRQKKLKVAGVGLPSLRPLRLLLLESWPGRRRLGGPCACLPLLGGCRAISPVFKHLSNRSLDLLFDSGLETLLLRVPLMSMLLLSLPEVGLSHLGTLDGGLVAGVRAL